MNHNMQMQKETGKILHRKFSKKIDKYTAF